MGKKTITKTMIQKLQSTPNMDHLKDPMETKISNLIIKERVSPLLKRTEE
jgi:hypothetical protein